MIMKKNQAKTGFWVFFVLGAILILLPGILGFCPYLAVVGYERSLWCSFLDYSLYLGIVSAVVGIGLFIKSRE